MDRRRPPQARRPMVPLAAAATVVGAAPAHGASGRRRPEVPIGSLAVGLAVLAAAFAVNSPLRDLLGLDGWAWRFLGFWGEAGALLALLGMLFRQPPVAWVGAGAFLAVALLLSSAVWAGHLMALALLGAVAAWQLRRQGTRDGGPASPAWRVA